MDLDGETFQKIPTIVEQNHDLDSDLYLWEELQDLLQVETVQDHCSSVLDEQNLTKPNLDLPLMELIQDLQMENLPWLRKAEVFISSLTIWYHEKTEILLHW